VIGDQRPDRGQVGVAVADDGIGGYGGLDRGQVLRADDDLEREGVLLEIPSMRTGSPVPGSMGRVAPAGDNAAMESFWALL
jgi:hypothetical protein